MNYTLTSESIIIEGREPINRNEFEKWLFENTALEVDELDRFWLGRLIWCQPDEMIREYIDQQTAFTEFDGIKKGIDRICNNARF